MFSGLRPKADVQLWLCALWVHALTNDDFELLTLIDSHDNVVRSRYITTGAYTRPEEDALSAFCEYLDKTVVTPFFELRPHLSDLYLRRLMHSARFTHRETARAFPLWQVGFSMN
jgi:hypothetical protein